MENGRARIVLWTGAAVLMGALVTPMVLPQAGRWLSDDEEAVERAAHAVIQERADLGTAVARDITAPEPRGTAAGVAAVLRPHYAQLAREGRRKAAEGLGSRRAEVRLHSVDVELFDDDSARVEFSQTTDHQWEKAGVEGSDHDLTSVSSHIFHFSRRDGRWILTRDASSADASGESGADAGVRKAAALRSPGP
ncbi:hypothetical protein [Streptomyces sp. CAU 1734]|uniref:hypothetical protein n=1 Tax=Streptomyces sp. CAU 1734 TaxID=3140360 RepID=UPI0032600D1B